MIYLENDIILFTCVPEKFIKQSNNKLGIKPLDTVSLPRSTMQGGMKYTGNKLKSFQGKDMMLLVE